MLPIYIISDIILMGVIAMGMWNKEQCPICEKETSAIKKSAIKKGNAYICRNCFLQLTSSGVGMPKIKELNTEQLKEIINGDKRITDMQDQNAKNYDMKTAAGLYQFCVDSGYGQGTAKAWGEKHFQLIVDNLKSDENVIFSFIGLHNYVSTAKHDGNFAYVLTNKRFMIAQKKLVGETFQTVSLNNINDITFESGMLFGILTIDTIREKFNIALNKYSAKNISNRLHEELDRIHRISSNPTTNVQLSMADEIKKYKELLDMGAISQEEFEAKKKELLNLK